MENQAHCLYCGKTDAELPLVNLTYKGQMLWICSLHLPLLIHKLDTLDGQLAEAVAKAQTGQSGD